MGKSFPCIICGKDLKGYEEDRVSSQPSGGVMCTTHGNYGSRVYDPFDGSFLAFNICDECLVKAGEQGRIFYSVTPIPVYPEYKYIPWSKDVGWKDFVNATEGESNDVPI